MFDDSRRSRIDDEKFEMMIVNQQFIKNATSEELHQVIDEAINAYIEEYGVEEWIANNSQKRRRED